VLALLISAPAAAELEERLPAETLIYVHWSGRSLTFDGSMLGQMIQQPGVAELFKSVESFIQDKSGPGKGGQAFSHGWKMADIFWQHPMAVAMTDIPAGGIPTGVLLVDLQKDKDAFAKELDGLVALITEDGEEEFKKVTIDNTVCTYLPTPKQMEMAFGFIDKTNIFFLAFGPGQAKALLTVKPAASLKTNKKFIECMKAVGGKNEQIAIYADVAALRKKIETVAYPADDAQTPEQKKKAYNIVDALGLSKLEAMAGTVRIVEKGMYTKLRLFTPAPHQGLLLPFSQPALSEADLAGVPKDALFAVAANVSPADLYAELRRVVGLIDPQTDEMIAGVIKNLETTLEADLEKDILAALSDTWIISSAPSQGGLLTGTVLSVDVKDEKLAAASLAKINEAIKKSIGQPRRRGPRLEQIKSGETEIFYIRTTSMRGPGIALMPAWAIHDKKLYVAVWPQVIASVIENKTQPLAATAQFQTLRGRVAKNASGLLYVNTPEIAKQLYPLELVLGTIFTNAIASELRWTKPMPTWPGSIQSVTKYLLPSIDAVSADADGITFEGYSSVPSVVSICPAAANAGVSVLIPALQKARLRAQQAVSMCNLRQICVTCNLHAAHHNCRLPANFASLIPYLGYPGVLVSPLSGKRPPRWNRRTKQLIGATDYTLIDYSRLEMTDIPKPHEAMLVYEDPANYNNRYTIVAFVDGSVRRVPIARFKKLLAEAFAASNASAKPAKK
jgi:hypothetical protein